MTRAQYLLRCRLRTKIRHEKTQYKRLWRLNQNPENQHYWDQMLRSEAYLSGLEYAMVMVDETIRGGRK